MAELREHAQKCLGELGDGAALRAQALGFFTRFGNIVQEVCMSPFIDHGPGLYKFSAHLGIIGYVWELASMKYPTQGEPPPHIITQA